MTDPSQGTSRDEDGNRLAKVLADQYVLEREVGRGGMGIVYRATDRRLKRPVAVKLLPPELTFRSDVKSRFLREAVSAAQLSHPNIVPIYSVDEREGLVYFIMGYVEGENLGECIKREGRMDAVEVRRILRAVADALAYAHERGVVHRDVKPDNIILDRNTSRPMVTDFGIARAVSDSGDTRLTATGVAIGTPTYMSPEQCAGDKDIDGRSDLYSLGVVAYQMLSGSPPFAASTTPALLVKHFTEQPEDLLARRGDVPRDLATIVMRLLEKKPEQRFADGRELVAALDQQIEVKAPPRRTPARAAADVPARGSANAPPARESTEKESRASRRKIKFRDKPLAERVRITRAEGVQWIGMSIFFFVINMVTWSGFPWFVFPAFGMGMGLMEKVSNLWGEGLRLKDIFGKRAHALISGAPAEQQQLPAVAQKDDAEAFAPRELLTGKYGATVREAVVEYRSVLSQVQRLSPADRNMIPDVLPTAKALLERVVTLAGALQSLDGDADPAILRALDERIRAAEGDDNAAGSGERRLTLLRKQRVSLQQIYETRNSTYEHFESAVLMLRNLALDVLKLRSAGIQSVIDDVNGATQEARALMREIGHAVNAADEVRGIDQRTQGR